MAFDTFQETLSTPAVAWYLMYLPGVALTSKPRSKGLQVIELLLPQRSGARYDCTLDIQPDGSFRNYGSQHEMVGQATIAGVLWLGHNFGRDSVLGLRGLGSLCG